MNELSRPLILASQSKARRIMLDQVDLTYKAIPANVDEPSILHELQAQNAAPDVAAKELSCAKALAVSQQNPEALVIGSDQILECEEQMLSKSASRDEALEKLKLLRGKTHTLISGVAVALAGEILWQTSDQAFLTMHDLDDKFLNGYADEATEALTSAVGGYYLESHGAWLFSQVKGDYFTILGMPLLTLLTYLRTEHMGDG